MPENKTKLEAEQAELAAVLSSGIFSRAPSLAQLLQYVCGKHFSGEQHLIKEYNIAVEALGRPADFDQKRDSIVRVEAHRLRKRLRDYYAGEGAGREIRIDLPSGGYAPVFIPTGQPAREAAAESGPETAPAPDSEAEAGQAGRSAGKASPVFGTSRWILPVAALALIGTLLVLYATQFGRGAPAVATSSPAQFQPVDLSSTANVSEVRISAGASTSFLDAEGHTWVADRYFKGGSANSDAKIEASGTLRPQLFQTWRQGEFTYQIPLKPGVYELTLHFCEPAIRSGSDTSRTFNVSINGVAALQEFDILNDAGAGQNVTARTWKDIRPAEGGILTLGFTPFAGVPVLSGISVIAGTAGRLRPIRIAAREEPYTDSLGRLWSPDRHYFGGRLVKRIEAITGTEDPELYRGERFGRLTYSIPVPADSTYTAILHFAETWFGGTGKGDVNARVFDILLNGLMLQPNLDVYKEAGGAFRAIRKTYRGLKPAPNGKLVFQFVPSKNNALINAIEILDEAAPPKS